MLIVAQKVFLLLPARTVGLITEICSPPPPKVFCLAPYVNNSTNANETLLCSH